MTGEPEAHDRALADAVLTAMDTNSADHLIILFGSVAAGAARADSDIDVAVDVGHRMSAEEKLALISAIAGETGRPVDLVDLRAAGEPLLGQILAGGRRISGTDERYARLITRHLFDAADFLPYRNRILAERRKAWIGK